MKNIAIKISGTVVLALAASALTACGITPTRPIAFDQAKPVAAERVLAYKSPTGQDSVPVKITRDVGTPAKVCLARVFIDGKPAALLQRGERVTFYVTPGRHILGAQLKKRSFDRCRDMLREIEINVAANSQNRFRISFDLSNAVYIQPTATE